MFDVRTAGVVCCAVRVWCFVFFVGVKGRFDFVLCLVSSTLLNDFLVPFLLRVELISYVCCFVCLRLASIIPKVQASLLGVGEGLSN